jgi:hypothetical protein
MSRNHIFGDISGRLTTNYVVKHVFGDIIVKLGKAESPPVDRRCAERAADAQK